LSKARPHRTNPSLVNDFIYGLPRPSSNRRKGKRRKKEQGHWKDNQDQLYLQSKRPYSLPDSDITIHFFPTRVFGCLMGIPPISPIYLITARIGTIQKALPRWHLFPRLRCHPVLTNCEQRFVDVC
jgi:hypothetical protein